jgi:MFS family permease
MSSFHGFFSLGGLSGAALGGGIIAVGWQDGRGALAVAVVMLAAAVFVGSHLLPSTPAAPSAAKRTKRFALPSPAVLGLVVLTFFANTVEGSANDWSSLYLSTVRGFSPAAAAAGLALFACGMAICRLFGGPVVARLGERRVVAWGGALVTIGMAVVVFSPWTFVSPAGFALVALGAANAIPIMMGAASRIPGEAPSAGVAATATGALLGFLIGPPVIGFIAHAHGLSTALSCICLVGLILLVGALVYRWQPAR